MPETWAVQFLTAPTGLYLVHAQKVYNIGELRR